MSFQAVPCAETGSPDAQKTNLASTAIKRSSKDPHGAAVLLRIVWALCHEDGGYLTNRKKVEFGVAGFVLGKLGGRRAFKSLHSTFLP